MESMIWLGVGGFGLNLLALAVGYGRLNQKVDDLKGEIEQNTSNTKKLIDLHEKRLDRVEGQFLRAPAGGSNGAPKTTL